MDELLRDIPSQMRGLVEAAIRLGRAVVAEEKWRGIFENARERQARQFEVKQRLSDLLHEASVLPERL